MLTSWKTLLDRMAAKVSSADSHTEMDIRQLQGLAEQQDEEAFLPLRREELGPQLPRRVIDLTGIVDDAVKPVKKIEGVTVGIKVGMAKGYGYWLTFTDPVSGEKIISKFGVDYSLWARYRDTPLWLGSWRPSTALRHALEPLRDRTPPELIETGGGGLFVPIHVPVGKERGAVLGAVVERLREIARMILPER